MSVGPRSRRPCSVGGWTPPASTNACSSGAVGPEEGDYAALRAPDLKAEPVVGLGREPHAGRDVRALYEISRVVREFRPHIVHTHKAKAGVLGRTAAWTHRVPATVHTFHGHLLTGYFSPAKTRAVVGVERTFARRTTRLVAVGSRVRDELLHARVGRRAQYVVVPPGTGFPSVPSREEARHRLGAAARRFRGGLRRAAHGREASGALRRRSDPPGRDSPQRALPRGRARASSSTRCGNGPARSGTGSGSSGGAPTSSRSMPPATW